jgi:thiol-disulfide isomerase/thioredoxin
MDEEQKQPEAEQSATPEPTGDAAEPSNSKVRLVAMIATFIALLAISIPFVLEHEDTPEAAEALVASHDAVPAADGSADDGGACMANAKPARMDFTLKNLDNQDVTLASFKGKVVLLNFWATWCGPCKAEIPGFVELQSKYQDDLVVIGFSVDDPADKARAFAEEYKINYPVLLGLGRDEVQDAYGPIWGIPTSFLISRDGRVCRKHMGIAPKAVFEKEIQALL